MFLHSNKRIRMFIHVMVIVIREFEYYVHDFGIIITELENYVHGFDKAIIELKYNITYMSLA